MQKLVTEICTKVRPGESNLRDYVNRKIIESTTASTVFNYEAIFPCIRRHHHQAIPNGISVYPAAHLWAGCETTHDTSEIIRTHNDHRILNTYNEVLRFHKAVAKFRLPQGTQRNMEICPIFSWASPNGTN